VINEAIDIRGYGESGGFMTYPRNAQPVGAGSGGADAEKAAFLRDLRALRDHAGLGSRDLAARAHFPEDTLKTAEAGPALPSLPVLQAYVRGCGAVETEWEDRWRRLNSDSTSGSNALPTRAPTAARPAARVVPFPDQDSGPSASEQDAIGFGLARVVRGLAPINPDPMPGGSPGGGGWFDPVAKAPPAASPSSGSPSSGSLFTPATSAPPTPPAPPVPPAPPAPLAPPVPDVSPGAPTAQYPTLSGYQAPETSYPGSYQSPGYEPPPYNPPEMFRTPAPEPLSPASTPGPAVPPAPSAPAATFDPLATADSSAAPGPSASSVSGATSATSASAKAHAAPAPARRHTALGAIAAVVAVLIVAVVVWLLLLH
jgi:hypothetical protein